MTTMVKPGRALMDDFAALWNSRTPSESGTQSMVPISEGSGRPIFCVHWGSGNIRFVRHTAWSWSKGRPVFGFEAVGLRDTACPLLSVDEMAERYLREMRQVQPDGPYALVGICSGSQIAFEMARRLTGEGVGVEILVVVNGACPGVSVFDPRWDLEDFFELRLAGLRRDFQVDDLKAGIPELLVALKARHWIDEDATQQDFYIHQLVWAACAYAQERYSARRYDHPLHTLRSTSIRGPGTVSWDRVSACAYEYSLAASDSIAIMRHPAFARIFTRM